MIADRGEAIADIEGLLASMVAGTDLDEVVVHATILTADTEEEHAPPTFG